MQEIILKKLPDYSGTGFNYKYSVGCTDVGKKISSPNQDLYLFECSTKLSEHPIKMDIGFDDTTNKLIAKNEKEYYEVTAFQTQLFNAIKQFSDRFKATKKPKSD